MTSMSLDNITDVLAAHTLLLDHSGDVECTCGWTPATDTLEPTDSDEHRTHVAAYLWPIVAAAWVEGQLRGLAGGQE